MGRELGVQTRLQEMGKQGKEPGGGGEPSGADKTVGNGKAGEGAWRGGGAEAERASERSSRLAKMGEPGKELFRRSH